MTPRTNQHWKTRKEAQDIADANNDPDDEMADYYIVEPVRDYFVIMVISAGCEPRLF